MNNNNLPIEKTVIIVKPDAVKRGHIGEVFEMLENVGLKLMGCRMLISDKETTDKHYPHDREWITGMGEKTLSNFKKMGLEPRKYFTKTDPFSIGQEVRKRLLKYWSEGPIVVTVWEGPHAISVARKLRGFTIPHDADPGTLHSKFSYDSALLSILLDRVVRTFVHASGSPDEARREIEYWFPKQNWVQYKTVADTQLL